MPLYAYKSFCFGNSKLNKLCFIHMALLLVLDFLIMFGVLCDLYYQIKCHPAVLETLALLGIY